MEAGACLASPARGGPCHVAGREQSASCPLLTRRNLRSALQAPLVSYAGPMTRAAPSLAALTGMTRGVRIRSPMFPNPETQSFRSPEPGSWPEAIKRAVLLRCPACGSGPLFRGLFQMHDACRACGVSFRRESGFYLGSIYINYGVTVIVTGAIYAALVWGLGTSHETALSVCLAVAVALPIVFFRHARSLLLALDGSVNRSQQESGTAIDIASESSRDQLAALAADDGRAGCAMGVALVLILLFGLGMAAVTIFFVIRSG